MTDEKARASREELFAARDRVIREIKLQRHLLEGLENGLKLFCEANDLTLPDDFASTSL